MIDPVDIGIISTLIEDIADDVATNPDVSGLHASCAVYKKRGKEKRNINDYLNAPHIVVMYTCC